MNAQERIALLARLGAYMLSDNAAWQETKALAFRENNWFIPAFIDAAATQIAANFLKKDKLEEWLLHYPALFTAPPMPKKVGIVMAGNIPLVGFHDFLCVFVSGHDALIKRSSKDEALVTHLVEKLFEWEPSLREHFAFASLLKNCDAYIATGSNNSGRYFDYYFAKYPHIIRRNRTAAAILDGTETTAELDLLADDIQLYFGLGCRNVTKLYVPQGYDFIPLLHALRKYDNLLDYHKYKHNFDYQLAILIMNAKPYFNSGAVILTEHPELFSPISHLHFEYYTNADQVHNYLAASTEVQCIVGHNHLPFGTAQQPALNDYADGMDTLAFLLSLR